MKCSKIQKYLIPYSENALPERLRQLVDDHVAACQSCARELEELSHTADILRHAEYPAMEPSFDIRSRVMSQIAREPVRKPWWTGTLRTYSAVAATLLFAAIVAVPMYMHTQDNLPSAGMSGSARVPAPAAPGMPEQSAPVPKAQVYKPSNKLQSSPKKDSRSRLIVPVRPKVAAKPGMPATPTLDTKIARVPSKEAAPIISNTESAPPPAAMRTMTKSAQPTPGPAGPSAMMPESGGAGSAAPVHQEAIAKDSIADKKDDVLILEKKLQDYPTSRTALTELLDAYRESGRAEDEYAIATRLTDLYPDNAQYWFSRAQAAERTKNPRTAKSSYQRAIDLGLTGSNLELAKARLKFLETNEKH